MDVELNNLWEMRKASSLLRNMHSREAKEVAIMSIQSETTLDEATLEDVVLDLMRGTGFLATLKGQIAKFIHESGNIDSTDFICPERADGKLLYYIYEYLQWIGMKQTCSVLLSESPVPIDTTNVSEKISETDFSPKLNALLEDEDLDIKFLNASTKSDDKILRDRERKEDKDKASSEILRKTPTAKSFDDLLLSNLQTPKNDETTFMTASTPLPPDSAKSEEVPPADTTFTFVQESKNKDIIEDSKDQNDSLALMGFNTPSNNDSKGDQNKNSTFRPEKLLFKFEDPFHSHLNDPLVDEVTRIKNLTLQVGNALEIIPPIESGAGEVTSQITRSVELFIREEEDIRALEERAEDMGIMEDEVINSSLSTEWSDEVEEGKDHNDTNPDGDVSIEVRASDSSKKYEVSEDFEEDIDSSPDKSPSGRDSFRNTPEDLDESNNNNNIKENNALNKSNSNAGEKKEVSIGEANIIINDKSIRGKSSGKKSDVSAEDISTSDILSLEIEEDDTLDVSLPTDALGLSQCDHVVSLK